MAEGKKRNGYFLSKPAMPPDTRRTWGRARARHDGNTTNSKVGWKSLLRAAAKKIPRRRRLQRQLVRRRFPRGVVDDAATAVGTARSGEVRRERGKEAGFSGGEHRRRRRRRNTRIAIDARTHQTNTWFTWPARAYHLAACPPHRHKCNDALADDPLPFPLPLHLLHRCTD